VSPRPRIRCPYCGCPVADVLFQRAECAWSRCEAFSRGLLLSLEPGDRRILGHWASWREAGGA